MFEALAIAGDRHNFSDANLRAHRALRSLRTQMYFRLSFPTAKNKTTAGNTSAFAGYVLSRIFNRRHKCHNRWQRARPAGSAELLEGSWGMLFTYRVS